MKKNMLIILIMLIMLMYSILSNRTINTSASGNTTHTANLTLGFDRAPVIFNVTNPGTQSPTEAGVTNVTIWFRVNDPNGISDLVNSSSYGELNRSVSDTRRINNSCAFSREINATVAEFQCIIGLWWFDRSGPRTINASIRDASGFITINETMSNNFTLNTLAAGVIGPSSLSWPSLSAGATNQTSNNDPLIINSTGNSQLNEINITGYEVVGEVDSSKFIAAGNFTIDVDTGTEGASGTKECGVNATSGGTLVNNTLVTITNAKVSTGNYTNSSQQCITNVTFGSQECLYYCIPEVPTPLSAQSYSSRITWLLSFVN